MKTASGPLFAARWHFLSFFGVVALLLHVPTSHGGKRTGASCMLKSMTAVGISERYGRSYETRMKSFSKWNVDFLRSGLADAIAPLILGKNGKKARAFLQCLRKETIVCQKKAPCLNRNSCTYNRWRNSYECMNHNQLDKRLPTNFTLVTKVLAHGQKKLEKNLESLQKESKALRAAVHPEMKASTCAELRRMSSRPMKSGTYTLQGSKKIYCEMDLDGGGWTLVWKHSYFQVDRSRIMEMRFFSPARKACVSLSDGWCNEPIKKLPGATEQMTAAFHNQQIVYAYKGRLNSELGKTWRGAILTGHKRIVDKCTRFGHSVNIPPEPSDGTTQGMIAGISFDKATLGVYRHNMETDSNHYRDDRRWRDCYLPGFISSKNIDNQMTMAIFVR